MVANILAPPAAPGSSAVRAPEAGRTTGNQHAFLPGKNPGLWADRQARRQETWLWDRASERPGWRAASGKKQAGRLMLVMRARLSPRSPAINACSVLHLQRDIHSLKRASPPFASHSASAPDRAQHGGQIHSCSSLAKLPSTLAGHPVLGAPDGRCRAARGRKSGPRCLSIERSPLCPAVAAALLHLHLERRKVEFVMEHRQKPVVSSL